MKKINQLVLLITCTISIILLLVYRHEYNRLRYVLEVFNFFGQSPGCNCLDVLNSSTHSYDWGPIPAWQAVDSDFIYSAFVQSKNEIQAIGFTERSSTSLQNCYVWYEDKPKPVVGKLKFSKIDQSEEHAEKMYKYFCQYDGIFGMPYAVSFTENNKQTKQMKKVLLHYPVTNKHNSSIACLLPFNSYKKSELFEFISYYKIMGVDRFIIYNSNVPYRIIHLLKKLSPKLGIEITSLPWNYPGSENDNMYKIIKEDCILRTYKQNRNVFVLDIREYIVPRYHNTLPLMLDHYDPNNETKRFRLKTLIFCTNNNDYYREPNALLNLNYDTSKSQESIMIYRIDTYGNDGIVNILDVSSEIAAVHKYVQCALHPSHSKRDESMLRFKADLMGSTLVKLSMFNRL